MTTTVTNTTMGNNGAVSRSEHELSWTGLSGLILWISLGSLFILCIGYATTGWFVYTDWAGVSQEYGLWEHCECNNKPSALNQDFVKATQAFATMGLIVLVASTVMAFCYMLIHFLPKKILLFGTLIGFIAGAVFLLIAVAVFGAEADKLKLDNSHLSYSFAFTVISDILCVGGAVVTFLQMRSSGTI